ncbi:MAG: Ig-like domain-containing protein, partial [bacterium]
MRHLRAALVLALAILPLRAHAQRDTPLHVVRVTPTDDAGPLAKISVSFDRPVAGSLDRSIDPATILHITPAVPGKLEWRDPVTIRLTPSAPLTPGTRYTVTVGTNFRAMDGSALAEPYGFAFRARGPVLLAGSPVDGSTSNNPPQHLAPNARFELVYSTAVDLARVSAAAFLEFRATCGGQRIIHLAASSQRRIRHEDPSTLEEAGGWQRDHSTDSLRRVVQLTPESPLPRGCAGELVVPSEVDAQKTDVTRWPFATYGDFRLVDANCREKDQQNIQKDLRCPTGPLRVVFSNPVRGGEVMRRVHLLPDTKYVIRDTNGESTTWTLEAKLKPRVGYAVVVDTAIRDVFSQPLVGNPAGGFRTTGYSPAINHPFGRLLVERVGAHTLVVQHVNVDTLIATIAPVPDSLEAHVLSHFRGERDSIWGMLTKNAIVKRIPVHNTSDRPMITGVSIPTLNAMRAHTPTLFAVKITGRSAGSEVASEAGMALIQVTDLGVHAKIGTNEGSVWVTGVSDGKVRPNATVVLFDAEGHRIATTRTNADGLARFTRLPVPVLRDTSTLQSGDDGDDDRLDFQGYVSVTLGTDRAVTAINRWDPDLSPYRFNVSNAWGDDRYPIAGALFTERGIYRPGERVYAKAIVRTGALGALRAPSRGDSVKWLFHDRDDGMLREVTTLLSPFGTADQVVPLPAAAAVGEYAVEIRAKSQGKWRTVASTSYRVAEYRPPEFLVDVTVPSIARLPGDKISATAQARYLFGAPMGGAVVAWAAEQTPASMWNLGIPGTDGWYIGDSGAWWEDNEDEHTSVFANKTDTLDARGARTFAVTLPPNPKGRAASVTIEATITDINRQTVSARTTTIVHPADFYVAAKGLGTEWFWKTGTPQSVAVITVRPDGQKITGVHVNGTIVRREWHRVRRERNGFSELIGEWVTDTIARCAVTTSPTPVPCTFTPKEGGMYVMTFSAKDSKGRVATTSFDRWAAGEGWVPWSDETQFKMDVIPERTRYAVGDTATVMFASPFTNADAWITVEREGLIEQRRIHITSGSTTIKFPITEAFAPNVFISILVSRGRSAPPGTLDDAGRPTIRVGYTELRVTPEVKRLTLTVAAERPEYRPGDSARVRVQVRDKQGRGARSEVTLWAVDEGVLSLTGYKTPDPLDLIYQARGLGMHLASNMTSVAPQIPEGEKGYREAGGGGGVAGADILRSRFQTTAFFLGSLITDAQGNAVANAKLPDNITTFRIMAVAVTDADRYGKGQSPLLVTRPLLARQALPRFVRPGDVFTAGAVINRRDGKSVDVKVTAAATGVTLRGDATQTTTLAALRGTEVRFPFQAQRGDTASFRFDVTDTHNADAVRVTIPVRPDHHPVVHTLAGMLRDTATIEFPLPPGMDLERSRLSLNLGVSPLAMLRGMQDVLHIYPYYCSEQVISSAVPLIALYRAQRLGGEKVRGDPQRDIARAVEMLTSRQRSDGGIGYWGSTDWTSPWLSAYAGMVMLDAHEANNDVKLDPHVLDRLATYLTTQLHADSTPEFTLIANWSEHREIRLREQIASLDFLSRYGRPDIAAENELFRMAAQLTVEDRARLAEIFARRKQSVPARRLIESAWAMITVEGAHAVLREPKSTPFYFASRTRPLARILTATLAIDPENALVDPIAQTLSQRARTTLDWYWNTQDYASVAYALATLERHRRSQPERMVRVRAGARVILSGGTAAQNSVRDSSIALSTLVSTTDGRQRLTLSLDAGAGQGAMYYYLNVTEVPLAPPVTPEDRGIQVERWYERIDGGAPIQSVAEGDLVRVRLRITVPEVREFVVLDDALPAGLEAVDLSLRTASTLPGPGVKRDEPAGEALESEEFTWYGSWDSGWWSPFDHHELRDDRVVYSATMLWKGSYTASYIARATTPGTFIRPPAHAEEMYNPAVNGRSDGGTFVVTPR